MFKRYNRYQDIILPTYVSCAFSEALCIDDNNKEARAQDREGARETTRKREDYINRRGLNHRRSERGIEFMSFGTVDKEVRNSEI